MVDCYGKSYEYTVLPKDAMGIVNTNGKPLSTVDIQNPTHFIFQLIIVSLEKNICIFVLTKPTRIKSSRIPATAAAFMPMRHP